MIDPPSSYADCSSTGGLILCPDDELTHLQQQLQHNHIIANNAVTVAIGHCNNSSSGKFSPAPGVISPDIFTNSTICEKQKKNWFSMNSFQKLSNQKSLAGERVMNIIRILAELLTTPNIPYPLYVGLFNKTCPGIRTTHLNKLADEITNCSKPISEAKLEPSYLLFVFPCVTATFLGLILGLSINPIFGLVFGTSLAFFIVLLIGIILYRSKNQRSNKALFASRKLARFMETLELFLQILFCYPKDSDLISKPITPLGLMINLSDYSTANHLSLGIVENIWTAVENKYQPLLTRLQSSCKIAEAEGRFKAICCLPTFVLVILFLIAIFTNATLLSIYRQNQIVMFTNPTILPIFVIMTCIVFLGFFSILPLVSKSLIKMSKSPARPLKLLRTSSNSLDFKTVDALVKEELEKVCLIISAFEAYQCKEQIRIFIMINTTDTCNRQVLANCIYQVQNLTMLRTTVPIISILAADFQTLVTDWTMMNPISAEMNFYQQFSDSFHLIHSTFHLPIYLDECFDCVPNIENRVRYSSNEIFCLRGGSSFESLNMAITGSKSTPLPVSAPPTTSTRLLSSTPRTPPAQTTRLATSSSSVNIGTRATALKSSDSQLTLKKIQQMFLAKSEITELNNKIIKQLLITATFFVSSASKLLAAYIQDARNPVYVEPMSESAEKLPMKSRKSVQHSIDQIQPTFQPGQHNYVPSTAVIIPPQFRPDASSSHPDHHYHNINSAPPTQTQNNPNHQIHYNHNEVSSNDESAVVTATSGGHRQCTCDYWFTFGKDKIPLARVVSEPMQYITSEMVNSHDDDDDECDEEDDDEDNDHVGQIMVSLTRNNPNLPTDNIEYSEDEQNPRFTYVLPDSVHAYRTN